jgi:RHS repeat-associated protein
MWFIASDTLSLPMWKQWDLSALTQKWVNGAAANYGVILWADNEDVAGYTMRFYSSEATNQSDRPYLEVVYSTEATTKTVYFLKDHLGSIRATVLDSAGAPVIGYDDYDPWGYPLALRTKPIPNAYLQGASKNKFTGKERDEEFGLNWDHFGGRDYDWLIGRWPTVDPLWMKHPNVSPYVYVLNNPMILVDPDGQQVVYHRVVQKPPTMAEIRENFAEKVALSNAYASGGLHQMAIGTLVLGVLEAAGSLYQKIDPFGIAGLYNPLAIGSLVVQEGRTISQAERAIGELLSKEGKAVEFLAESNMGRTADALVGGVATEFKTVSNLTSKDIGGALARRILEGRGQAGNIIIDARGQKGLTKELAENAIKRAFVKDSDKKLLKEIRIVGEDFDITIPRIE